MAEGSWAHRGSSLPGRLALLDWKAQRDREKCGIGSQTLGGIIRDSGSDRKAFGGRDSCGAGKVCGHSGVGVIGFSGIDAVQLIPVIMWGTGTIVPGAALYLSHKGHFCLWS